MSQPEDLKKEQFAELTTVDGHVKVFDKDTYEIAKRLLALVGKRMEAS